MLPPEIPTVAPAYADLFAEGAFSQRAFVDADSLRREAAIRGLDQLPLFPARTAFEPLDRLGAFCPIGFSFANYPSETTWLNPDPQTVAWREELPVASWDTYRWRSIFHEEFTTVSERYSPWQLLYLPDVLDVASTSYPLVNVIEASVAGVQLADVFANRLGALHDLDEAWRPTIKLLVALQPRIWPFRAQRTTLVYQRREAPNHGPRVDPLAIATREFDPAGVIRRFDITLSDVAQLYRQMAAEGRRLDPVPHWFRIHDNAPRQRTDLLRGHALRARDFYDACFVLRAFYWQATQTWLPLPDELDQASRGRDLRRFAAVGGLTSQELRSILIREGVYPHRLHLFVEGDTEEIVINGLLEATGRADGAMVTNLRGVNQTEKYQQLFSAATEYAARTVLIADHEGGVLKALSRLRRIDILTRPGDVLVWEVDGQPSSFEEANFSYGELLNGIRACGRKTNPKAKLTLTAKSLRTDFQAAVAAAARDNKQRPALATFALKRAADPACGSIRVSKRDLGKELLAILLRAIDRAGDVHEASPGRPLLGRLREWLIAS